MAKAYRPSDPLLIGIFTARDGLVRGVRKSGTIVVRDGNGGHKLDGVVKTGWSVNDVRLAWEARLAKGHWPGCHLRVEYGAGGAEDLSRPIVSASKAERRRKDAERRDAARIKKLEEDEALQVAAAAKLGEGHPLLDAKELFVASLVETTRFACSHSLGHCARCRKTAGWMEGGVRENHWLCGPCIDSVGGPDLTGGTPSLPYDGRKLALAVAARPEVAATLNALRFLG